MADHFINLNCANCGAKLEVFDDMDRFACGYCGTEMLVQRRGGTVALRSVTGAIKKVQIGTDKTAAELAIARFEPELRGLRADEAALSKDTGIGSSIAIGWCVILLLIGAFMIVQEIPFGVLLVAVGVGFGVALFVKRRRSQTKLEGIRDRILELEIQLAEKKRIADS